MGLVMLFSAFTGSRPGTLLADDDSSCRDTRESSVGDSSINTLAYDSDGDTLVDDIPNLKARNIRPGIICYGDIDLFLLRNPDNPVHGPHLSSWAEANKVGPRFCQKVYGESDYFTTSDPVDVCKNHLRYEVVRSFLEWSCQISFRLEHPWD